MARINGFQSALEALRGLDSGSQERILKDIAQTDPGMAQRLKSSLRTFEDLLLINPQGLLKLFQEVKDVTWILALRGKSSEFVENLMKPLARRKSELLLTALTKLGPQPVSKVESAQQAVLKKALELESQGQLIFRTDEDSIV